MLYTRHIQIYESFEDEETCSLIITLLNIIILFSMGIGSAYVLKVCLLQTPGKVTFLWYNWDKEKLAKYTFSHIFPHWDVITAILSVFLLTYIYQEGKSNYFKEAILILSFLSLFLDSFLFQQQLQNKIVLLLDLALYFYQNL